MLLRTQYLRAGCPSGGGPPGYNASAAAGARQFCGLPGGGPFDGDAPFGRQCLRGSGSAAILRASGRRAIRRQCLRATVPLCGGGSFGGDDPSGRRKISKRKVGGHRKSRYLCTPDFRKMPGPPGRAAARGQWRRSTVGNDGPAVGSGWQRHNAADGFGCFGTQTAPPTCSDGGSNGRREQTGCSAVRLAHLLWEQGVAGSNPVSPTQ